MFKRYQNTELPKIRSCLNYIKKVLYAHKLQYQKEFFQENITPEKLKNYDTRYDTDLEF